MASEQINNITLVQEKLITNSFEIDSILLFIYNNK